jgi:hypothetical protein
MNEVYIATPADVTLEMIGDVLRRRWRLDDALAQPSVDLGGSRWAYVAEFDERDREDPLLLAPDEREALTRRLGSYRLFSVRYASPTLGRNMARTIASSELAEGPMLLDHDDTFLSPREFLERTADE